MEWNGILPVDKPRGITSHDVVAKVRRALRMKRVGHAGTLDPDASGLLLVCLGQATKVSSYLMEGEKTYHVRFCLGKVSDTYDSTGTIRELGVPTLDQAALENAVMGFCGEQMQVPPPFSAVKIRGKKLYEYARADKTVEAPARKIHVREFVVQRYEAPEGEASIVCSKGTYVRSLVHDLGQRLGVGALTTSIRRMQSGAVRVEDAAPIQHFEDQLDPLTWVPRYLRSIAQTVTSLPHFRVKQDASIERMRHGMPLSADEVGQGVWLSTIPPYETTVLVVDGQNESVALATWKPDLSLAVRRVI